MPDAVERHRRRVTLADGAATTVHVVSYAIEAFQLRVERLDPEEPMEEWCARERIPDAVPGGFAVKPDYDPLGEVRIGGDERAHRPFQGGWAAKRAAVASDDGRVSIAPRDELPSRPPGDLLQAGPLLVRAGRSALAGVPDPEGFSATAEEFDQDLTDGREPRLAFAVARERLLAVAVDGRGDADAGMTPWELADLVVGLGAQAALNLDGGSAGVVVSDGRRVNVPRDDEGNDMESSSPSVTALVLRRSGRYRIG